MRNLSIMIKGRDRLRWFHNASCIVSRLIGEEQILIEGRCYFSNLKIQLDSGDILTIKEACVKVEITNV